MRPHQEGLKFTRERTKVVRLAGWWGDSTEGWEASWLSRMFSDKQADMIDGRKSSVAGNGASWIDEWLHVWEGGKLEGSDGSRLVGNTTGRVMSWRGGWLEGRPVE